MHAQVGDEIVVDSMEVGTPERRGTILEVRVAATGEHYLVRWSDGRESFFFPGSTSHSTVPAGRRAD
jgi:hypothetical protein